MLNTEIEVTNGQLVIELEQRIVNQMTTHHIQIQNRDLEISKLRRELVVLYTTLKDAYVKNPRAIRVCEEKIAEYGRK